MPETPGFVNFAAIEIVSQAVDMILLFAAGVG